MLGTLLANRYKILRVLGAGGFGQTYVAEDTQNSDWPICVVKHLKPASNEPQFLEVARRLFDTEVDTLSRLGEHEQIPQLLDSFEDDSEFYLVQEFIEGTSFSDELTAGKKLNESEAIEFLEGLLSVLEFIHTRQVIHRDVKPSNIIRRQHDGKLVLIDFGAVKEIRTQLLSGSGQTGFTVGIGTQGYTPSEQLAGKPRFSSDIYALGVTVIQALTGLSPTQLPEDPYTSEIRWRGLTEVSEGLAILLNKMVRQYVNHRYQTANEVLKDLNRLDELTDAAVVTELLDATQMPQPLGWKQSLRQGLKGVAIASVAITSLVLGIRQLGWLAPLELAVYDHMVRLRANPGPDPRLLVIEITEADLQAQQRATPSDQAIAEAIAAIKQHQPRVIGLDLHRNLPQEPGHKALMAQLESSDVIAITKLGDDESEPIPPPQYIPMERIGFNDFVVDTDGVIRRNLMYATAESGDVLPSFSLNLALKYLSADNIQQKPSKINPAHFQLNETVFKILPPNAGGYQHADTQGYQILLDYRAPKNVIPKVTLTEVLNGQLVPDRVKDRVVLIGTTAPGSKDLFFTPYSGAATQSHQMPGVIIHAQMVSQLLSNVLDQQPLIWFWPDWVEGLWIAAWAVVGGSLAWWIRNPLILWGSGAITMGVLMSIHIGLFSQRGWIPMVAPAIALVSTGGGVIVYRANQRPKSQREIGTAMMPSLGAADQLRKP
ncbi:MAG: CHASE2 domain-containing protein [Cyanothece sp. SIO1E1]|nr:CHASE2 domain-containing protein [Cyanothece sp. SIO1E1]